MVLVVLGWFCLVALEAVLLMLGVFWQYWWRPCPGGPGGVYRGPVKTAVKTPLRGRLEDLSRSF